MALQIAPLIVAERRILISLYLFMAGIILFHLLPPIWHRGEYLDWLLGGSLLVSIAGLGAAIYARHSAGHDRGLFILVAFIVGFALASLQFAQHDQPRIKHGVTADIQGTLIKIDGNADARSSLWIRLDATSDIVQSGILPAGGIVLRAKGMTAACKDLETAFVMTSITSRYPCCSGKLVDDISQKKQDKIT